MPLKISGAEVRQSFINFFKEKGHTYVPSASLVPGGDQTLLFTNAGMVQFKDVFLGIDKRPYNRAVNSQKCMRVAGKHNDLEDVGSDNTHHTFFEMLGNWSFGDYYKKEAISWAWQLLTEVWKMDKNLLWATCFQDEKNEIPRDEEAAAAWLAQPGFLKDHLVFLGRKDNFWEMAETGPCGPCSEIYIDQGEDFCDHKGDPHHQCDIQHNCRRFLEFWNLVFIQYNRLSATELINLPAKHVDTGMGLDRITAILQGVKSNYFTDLLLPIMDTVLALTGQTEKERQSNLTPYRVIADHSRAAVFLIADGVVPGNVGRNYVCRMIIRRASRFGAKLGLKEPFLAKTAKKVIEIYGDAFPELKKNEKTILDNITREEKRFQSTVEIGLSRLQDYLEELKITGNKVLDGHIAFDLYATNGLPFEIARDVAREQGLDIEQTGFENAMAAHRVSSSAGNIFGEMGGNKAEFYADILRRIKDTLPFSISEIKYDPYSQTKIKTEIIALLKNDEVVKDAQPGDKVEVILPSTCFYIESGGQVADSGWIKSDETKKWVIRIDDVQRPAAGLIIHIGEVLQGTPQIGDKAFAEVDAKRRMDIMRNHTATHLLHAELRKILGEYVRQSGSMVAPDRLRFDFTQNEPLSMEILERLEDGINQKILLNYPVKKEEKDLAKAIEEGAMALFGEKYSERVRTISIHANGEVSYELCGGTHVDHTSEIGTFIILSESSIASGIRRIEAITGSKAYEFIHFHLSNIKKTAAKLSSSSEEIYRQIESIISKNEIDQKKIKNLQEKLALSEYEKNKKKDSIQIGEAVIYTTSIEEGDNEILRKLCDIFRKEYTNGVFAVSSQDQVSGKFILMIAVTETFFNKTGINAVEIIKQIGPIIGGGGGGKPLLAQAGGNNPSRIRDAFLFIKENVKSKLEK